MYLFMLWCMVMVLMMMMIDDVGSDSGVGGYSDNHGVT